MEVVQIEGGNKMYHFDGIFPHQATQKDIFEEVKPFI
jgi:hypothetical protein